MKCTLFITNFFNNVDEIILYRQNISLQPTKIQVIFNDGWSRPAQVRNMYSK